MGVGGGGQERATRTHIYTYLYMGDTGVTNHLAHFMEDSSFEASHS